MSTLNRRTLRAAVLAGALIATCTAPAADAHKMMAHDVTPADSASISAKGCTVTKHADHSVAIRCQPGQSATLTWSFIHSGQPRFSVTCRATACHARPVVTDRPFIHHSHLYEISERVHDHVVVSLTATYPLV